MKHKFATGMERKEAWRQINKHKEEGMTTKDAAKQVGISDGTYYAWTKSFAKMPKPKPKVKLRRKQDSTASPTPYLENIQIEQQTPSKVACVIGTPQEVAEVLKGMK